MDVPEYPGDIPCEQDDPTPAPEPDPAPSPAPTPDPAPKPGRASVLPKTDDPGNPALALAGACVGAVVLCSGLRARRKG